MRHLFNQRIRDTREANLVQALSLASGNYHEDHSDFSLDDPPRGERNRGLMAMGKNQSVWESAKKNRQSRQFLRRQEKEKEHKQEDTDPLTFFSQAKTGRSIS